MWDIIEDFLKSIIIILGTILLFCLPAMYLWNNLRPYIFSLPTLNFWQTAGLLLLCQLFFNT
jgi:hypothetical protein